MIQRLKMRVVSWLLKDLHVDVVDGEPVWFVDLQRVDVNRMSEMVPGQIVGVYCHQKPVRDCVTLFALPERKHG